MHHTSRLGARRRHAAALASLLLAASLLGTSAAQAAPGPRATGRSAAALIGNHYYDECGDGPDFDLKKVQIIDDGASDVTFTWGTCPGRTVPTTAGSAITFLIDDNTETAGPEMAVRQFTTDATWQVFDTTGSTDDSDWLLVQAGGGSITSVEPSDGGPRDVGTLRFDAVAANFPLSYFVSLVTRRGSAPIDVMPEPRMPPIQFPNGCDFFSQQAAVVTTDGIAAFAKGRAVLDRLAADAVTRADGSRLAWPIDDDELAAIDALPGVRAVRPVMFRALADPEPTQWAQDQTHLPAAWQVVPRATGRIAVLDQGVDADRDDLRGRVGAGFDAVTRTPLAAGRDSALGPHGTSVSGIIAGSRDNGVEVAGVNDGATILPVRVFDHASCADDVSIASGIDWAVANGAEIINLSLGGHGTSGLLERALLRATDAGIIVIAATGNDDDTSPGVPNYPAAYPNVIGIGATDPDGVAFYSQRAATEFVAPGGALSGSRASDWAVLGEWDRLEYQSGTSFAAPMVAALVSLWLRDHPGATLPDVRAALRAAAVDVPDTTRDGGGLVDAHRLLGSPTGAARRIPAAAAIDGDPTTSHRLDQDRAVEAGLAVSALRFPAASTTDVAVLARADTFADALSGAPLGRDGPLLFNPSDHLDVRVRNELARVLAPGATLYLLGGPRAISPAIEGQLRDALVEVDLVRLSGPDRYATSREVVREIVRRDGLAPRLLLARGHGPADDPNGTAAWADALAGASIATARGWPLLVVPTAGMTQADLSAIHESVVPDGLVDLLGGPNALSPRVATQSAAVRTTRRVAGTTRAGTAARIATTLWGVGPTGPANFVLLNLQSGAGWYLGLASAGYAAEISAPLLAAWAGALPAESVPLLSRCGAPQVELWVAGAASQVPGATLAAADRLDGAACPR